MDHISQSSKSRLHSSLYCETCGIEFGDSLSLARHRGTAGHRKRESRGEQPSGSGCDLASVRALVEELARTKGDRVVEARRSQEAEK